MQCAPKPFAAAAQLLPLRGRVEISADKYEIRHAVRPLLYSLAFWIQKAYLFHIRLREMTLPYGIQTILGTRQSPSRALWWMEAKQRPYSPCNWQFLPTVKVGGRRWKRRGVAYLLSVKPEHCRKLFFPPSDLGCLWKQATKGHRKSHSELFIGAVNVWRPHWFHYPNDTVFVVSLGVLWKQQARARKQVSPSLLQYGKTVVPISEQTLCAHPALSASAPFCHWFIRTKGIIVAASAERLL